ncbi:MAG: protease pro-enzyme activation domain-containing protein [Solirubrobacteraceae bacterium]
MARFRLGTHRRLLLALGIVVAVAAAAAGGLAAGSGQDPAPSSSVTHSGIRARLLGATRARAPVRFSLVLRLHHARLERFLAGLYDPRSRVYHHFINAGEFGRRFGVSDRQLAALLDVLRRGDISITGQYPQRTAVDAFAPAAVVDRFFHVRLMDYRAPGGRRFHSPLSAPQIPGLLRGIVSGVAGLQGGFFPRADDVPSQGITPAIGTTAYDIKPLYAQGIKGQGETVAVVESSNFTQSDLDNFAQQYGLPPFKPQNIPIPRDGPATDTSPEGEGEAELDVELIHEVAPAAEILDYNAPGVTSDGFDSLGDMLDKIVADGRAKIVSDSMGYCELGFPGAALQRDEQSIQAAIAHGVSIFKSTGDEGAYQCERFDNTDHRLSVEWPASSAGVVAVGGTALAVSATGGYAGEAAWEDVLERGGGGGGLSAVIARPSWQSAPGVVSRFSNGKRQIPDVAADAAPATGWAAWTDGTLSPVAGTSAAAPFWAGAMALIDQYSRQHGASAVGYVNPMLYRIASTPQPAPPFHDVTVGTNRYYPATTGWDFATGLGSPDVYNLAQDVLRYLKSHPAK